MFLQQLKRILNTKKFTLSFWVIMAFFLFHFVNNVRRFWGMDVLEISSPSVMLLISGLDESMEGRYFMQFLPFLIVLPAAFLYLDETDCGEHIYGRFRTSSLRYITSGMAAVFCATFIAFEIPQLTELLLNHIGFHADSMMLYQSFSYFSEGASDTVRRFPLYRIFLTSPLLYSLIMSLKLSVFCSSFAVFAYCVSTSGFRLKVLLFLPVYLVLNLLSFAEQVSGLTYSSNYADYLSSFCLMGKLNWGMAFAVLALIWLASVILAFRYSRKDCF